MLVVGAGGLALQMYDELLDRFGRSIRFWADSKDFVNPLIDPEFVICETEGLHTLLSVDNQFIVAVGDGNARKQLAERFSALGGSLVKWVSPTIRISAYANVENGAVILQDTLIEAGASIGIGVLCNVRSIITHEVAIGAFSTLGPGVTLNGACRIGSGTFIGAGAIVLPKVAIGDNCIIGAGAVVTGNISDGAIVGGIPARPLRK